MKALGSVLLIVVGLGLLGLGLLFLIGASGQVSRLAVAAAGLVGGGVAVGFGLKLFKAAQAESPVVIRAEILALARQRSGEISAADVQAKLGSRGALANPVLEALQAEGQCQQQRRGGVTYYVFAGLQARLAVRRCEFCQAELPLDDDLAVCPQCGGSIKTGVKRLSFSDDEAYSMDDE